MKHPTCYHVMPPGAVSLAVRGLRMQAKDYTFKYVD